jgi:hypothetical protein
MEDGIVLNEIVHGTVKEPKIEENAIQRKGDASHLVASLDILQPDSYTNDTLLSSMERNLNAFRFLQLTANYWPEQIEGSSILGQH